MLTTKLLNRGDVVCIERGRLIIQPASGKAIPVEWEADHAPAIKKEILAGAGLVAFEYESYKTGQYGKHKAGGVTLQFRSLVAAGSPYVVFNADVTRQRTTASGKAGSLLPRGQFRIGERSHFYKFWVNAGLPLPKRLASFHDYMGKLRSILFTGDIRGERIDAGSLFPVNVSAAQVRSIFVPQVTASPGQYAQDIPTRSPDNSQTSPVQLPDNCQTNKPDKEMPRPHVLKGIQRDLTTGGLNHGNTVIREHGYKRPLPTPNTDPSEQSVDDWLNDYDSATNC